MSLELQFKVSDGGSKQSIEGIGSAISTLQARTKLSSGELDRWQAVVKGSVDAGYSLSKSIDIANKTFERGGVPIKAFTAGIKEQISELKRAEDQAQRTEGQYSRLATLMGARASGIGLPLGAQGAIGGLGMAGAAVGVTAGAIGIMASWAKVQGDAARETLNLSEKTGLSIRETQLFSKAATLAGVNAGSLIAAVRTLSRGLAEGGEEGKKQREVLDQLGVKYEDTLHRILPVQQILEQVGKKLKEIGAGPQRDLFEATLFGRGGLELTRLITNLKEYETEVEKSNTLMSDAGAHALDTYAQKWDLLWQRIDAVKRGIAGPWVDVFLAMSGGGTPGITGYNIPYGQYSPLQKGPQPYSATTLAYPGMDVASGKYASDFNTARNNEAFEAFKGRRTGDKRDIQAELAEARKSLSALDKPFLGNTAAGDNERRGQKIKDAETKIRSLEAKEEALQKAKTLAGEVDRFGKTMSERDLLPIAKIFAERDDLIKKGAKAGPVTDFALTGATAHLGKEGIDIGSLVTHLGTKGAIGQIPFQLTDPEEKQARERSIKSFEFQSKNESEGYSLDDFNKRTIDAFNRKKKAEDQIRLINVGGDRSAAQLQSQHAQTIASASTFNQYDAITSAYKIRADLATKIRDIELESAKHGLTAQEKAVEDARIQREYKLEGIRAEIDAQQKLIELDHKRQQEFQQFSKGIFDAITSHDPTTAIRSWGITQGRALGATVFGNAAGSLIGKGGAGAGLFGNLGNIIPGQGDTPQSLTTVGKLLQNTPLGKVFGGKGSNPDLIANNGKLERVGVSLDTLDADLKSLNQTLVNPQAAGAPYIQGSGNNQFPGTIAGASAAFGGASFLGSVPGYVGATGSTTTLGASVFPGGVAPDTTSTTLNYPGLSSADGTAAAVQKGVTSAFSTASLLKDAAGVAGAL